MDADASLQPHIDRGRGVVEVSSARRDERHSEIADVLLGRAPLRRASRTVATIDEEAVARVDEDIGHRWVVEVSLEGLEGRMPHAPPGGRLLEPRLRRHIGRRRAHPLAGLDDERLGHGVDARERGAANAVETADPLKSRVSVRLGRRPRNSSGHK